MIEPTDSTEEGRALPTCPRCGALVSQVTMSGPMERTATPCGCPVAPGALEGPTDGSPEST